MSGQAELSITGSNAYLQMYVGGGLDLTGQWVMNQFQNPEAFQAWVTATAGSSQSIKKGWQREFRVNRLRSERRCESGWQR
ncbi:MAG: hypothetical protein ACJ07L_14420 [Opitutales bacterium]